jgi:DNA polymerase
MPILHRDFETRSVLNLKKVGAWVYARHPITDVWCFAYAVDDGEIKLWVPGDPIPPEWIEAASNPDWLVVAHNDFFERQIEQHIMAPRYGWPLVPLDRHRCSQAAGLAMALPAALEMVATVLGLPHQKDKAGHDLMKEMARPRKPRAGEDPNGIYWLDDPDRRARLGGYCKQDVATERAHTERVPLLSAEEQALWNLDAQINNRGIHIDRELLDAATQIEKAARTAVNAEVSDITGGTVKTVDHRARMLAWLAARGCELKSMQKPALVSALSSPDLEPAARRVIELRLEGAHVSKLGSLRAWLDSDDRVRGAFRFHGAATGRWTSHGVQVHNMKRQAPGIDTAIAAVMTGDVEHLRQLYPRPLSAIGDITRALFCAAPGSRFIAADFSGVESRITAWVSGQQSKVDQWLKFDETGNPEDEPYYRVGLDVFGLPTEVARGTGKTGDLAFGFMGSVPAWHKLAPPGDTTTDEEIEKLRDAWREAHPHTTRFWNTLNRKAIEAVQNPGKPIRSNVQRWQRFAFEYDGEFLRMHLPSGRKLSYPHPKIITGKYDKPAVSFMDNAGGKWLEVRNGEGAYGATWIENLVQAVARDVFATAMLRLEAAGYRIVLHVHDEIVAEMPDGVGSTEEFLKILTMRPDWAEGMPIAAKVRNGPRFSKAEKPAPAAEAPRPPHVEHEDDPLEELIGEAPPIAPEDPQLKSEPADNPKDEEPRREQRESDRAGEHAGAGTDWRKFDFGQYAKEEPETERGNWQVLVRYVYQDAGDRPYARVNRRKTTNPKRRFFHEHWNGSAWVPEKPPGGPIPFRLPQLIKAAPDEIVVVCEGEKDTLTAVELGFVATCNPGGAGKFDENLARWFTGKKQVILCEDHDKAGEAHVAKAADMLHGTVPDIRVVRFPELPEKGDLSDWVALGGTRDGFLARAVVAPAGNLESIRASSVTIREISWIWPGRLAIGKLGLIVGLPDEGKGQILCDIAARITRGQLWPCDEGIAPIGNVILLTAEDDPDDTVVPRLIAAGADLDRVEIVQMIRTGGKRRMFSLVSDLEFLRQKIVTVGDVRMVQIDPISAYLGVKQIDSFRTPDVRAVLGPVTALSTELAVSMLGIMHFNKRTDVTNALLRISDSMAFGATARHVYAVINDLENQRKLFVKGKNNLTPYDQQALSYTFDTRQVGIDPKSGNQIIAPRIVWGKDYVDVTATEAMQAAADSKSPSRRGSAKEFLMDTLSAGPVPSADVLEAAKEEGISKNTLYRAKDELKIKARKDGPVEDGERTWQWHLPKRPESK